MSDNARLAAGLAEYLNAVRGAPGTPLETARLLADRDAHGIAYPLPAGMTVVNSFVARAGDEVPVRIYRPAGEGALPAIVYFHGGGFTTGSIESYQPLAMALAEATGAVVISVHYARLPEATPRAAVEQCYDALAWTARMASALAIDPARIAIAGDSAGAFLAVQVAILARDRGGPNLICQLLAYGTFDVDEGRAAYAAVRPSSLPIAAPMPAIRRSSRCRCAATLAACRRRSCWRPSTMPWSTRAANSPSGCALPACIANSALLRTCATASSAPSVFPLPPAPKCAGSATPSEP